MDPEEKELIKRSIELSQENNKLLKSLHRSMRWGQVWGFVRLLIIIVPLVYGFYFIQPYLENLLKVYTNIQGVSGGSTSGGIDVNAIKGLINGF